MTTAAFSSKEIGWSLLVAGGIQSALIVVMLAVDSGKSLVAEEAAPPKEIPIAVKPLLDEIHLAKLGGKKVKNELPDKWRKPVPVKRQEAVSAPTETAEKTPEAIPESKPLEADSEEEPPKPEDEVVKEAPELPPDVQELKEEPKLQEEGFADGYEEGQETDKLKAMWVSRYRITIINWLRQGFNVGGLDCAEVEGKAAVAAVQVGPTGTVTGFTMTDSGASSLDERARSAVNARVGEQLPPPPDNLDTSDVYNTTFSVKFNKKCP